ncbi:MAG: hypothetical protein ACYC4S_12315 [Rhodoferax sp.]
MIVPNKHSGYPRDGIRLYFIPKAPDMSGANDAARAGAAVSADQWAWTKERQPKLDEQSDRMIQMGEDQYALNREQQVFQQGLSRKYDDRYWESVAPMQDEMMADAREFDTEGRREELAGEASADVNQAYSSARGQESRAMSRMGINPASGKALAMQNQTSIAQAAAQAGAMNKVRSAARLEGYGRKVDANAMMSGMSGFSSSAAGLSNSFGQSGQNSSGIGMNGLSSAASQFYAGANGAANGLQSASQNLRSNAIESAKNPAFDAAMGLASGAMKMYGASDRRDTAKVIS